MSTIAFLGTGLLGSGMVDNLLRRGNQVTVWNRTESKAHALAAAGAAVARSPEAAVAGVERVHMALSDDAAVDAMLDRIAAAVGGAVVVDHTTTSPAGTRRRVEQAAQRGVRFVHAPVC